MRELGLDLAALRVEFPMESQDGVMVVVVSTATAERMRTTLVQAVQRSYTSDANLAARSAATGMTPTQVLGSILPPAGSVRSGDFGEILSAVFQASQRDEDVFDPKKWRLKADRTKAAPFLDIQQMIVPEWPESSERDELLCAEVKAKATRSAFRPIDKAIEEVGGNRIGRVAKTLGWLKDRAIAIGLDGTVSLAHVERFLEASEHPPARHVFSAIAVVDSTLVAEEIRESTTAIANSTAPVFVISVPELRALYEAIYGRLLEPEVLE